MDKTILKKFAIDARNQLIEEIRNKAALIGITEEGIHSSLPKSTSDLLLFDIGTVDPYILKGKEIRQYHRLVNELKQREENTNYETAYETLIEEIAYTWFNRLIAIRFMEVNNYMPNRMRVLSSGIDGVNEPELVTNYLDSGLDLTQEDLQQLAEWQLDGSARSMDHMFQFLFIKQANALNENLPELFERTDDYAELLLTISYNNPEGVLYKLVHGVPEEYFDVETEDGHGQVEIIGWLYQYYNTEKKDEVFARPKSKKIPKEDIPAVTQLFTPDWIVQYMVQNSLGRLWIEKLLAEGDNRTEKEIAESFNWKYYIPEAEQELEVQKELIEIRADRKNLQLEEITFMDPAMGSYHIGVYAFEVFMQLYQSQGYSPRDAAELIVEKNLYGIDIDNRAYQLSYFAILMKARQYNRRILTKGVSPNLYSIIESNPIDRNHLDYLGTNIDDKKEWVDIKEDIIEILDSFIDAKEYGSILKIVESYDFEAMKKFVSNIKEKTQISFETIGIEQTQNDLLIIISSAETLSSEYDVIVTNPPYLGHHGMNVKLKDYLGENYPNSKSDLFAVFMEQSYDLTKENGFYSLITQQSWMFLYSYSELRTNILSNSLINNILHLGANVFEEISGEVVQSSAFTMSKKRQVHYKPIIIDLLRFKNSTKKESEYLRQNYKNYRDLQQLDFLKIPNNTFMYRFTMESIEKIFSNKLNDYFEVFRGPSIFTISENIKKWYEVNFENIAIKNMQNKWKMCDRSGSKLRWTLPVADVVLEKTMQQASNYKYQNKKCIIWPDSRYGSVDINARLKDEKTYIESGVNGIYTEDTLNLYVIYALFNTGFYEFILAQLINGQHFSPIYIKNLPYPYFDNNEKLKILEKTDQINITINEMVKFDEHYLDFQSIFVNKDAKKIEVEFEKIKQKYVNAIKLIEMTEKELYEMISKSLDIEFPKNHSNESRYYIKNLNKNEYIKRFISYAVGCMFGRYSLDEEGLIFAGGEWDENKYETFKPVEDNVLLITDEEYFDDDIFNRFVEFVRVVYGAVTLEENLEFIADSLAGRGSPREKIRNYFTNNFYKDHVQIYQKHPIYWMYDSSAGKTRKNSTDGFKALVYMHRYEEDTTGKVRMDYLHKVQRAYEQKLDNLEYQMELTDSAREIADAEKEIEKLTKQLKELQDYDDKIGHLALSRIPIDLDDGVRVNYDKVQTDENGKKLKILTKR